MPREFGIPRLHRLFQIQTLNQGTIQLLPVIHAAPARHEDVTVSGPTLACRGERRYSIPGINKCVVMCRKSYRDTILLTPVLLWPATDSPKAHGSSRGLESWVTTPLPRGAAVPEAVVGALARLAPRYPKDSRRSKPRRGSARRREASARSQSAPLPSPPRRFSVTLYSRESVFSAQPRSTHSKPAACPRNQRGKRETTSAAHTVSLPL